MGKINCPAGQLAPLPPQPCIQNNAEFDLNHVYYRSIFSFRQFKISGMSIQNLTFVMHVWGGGGGGINFPGQLTPKPLKIHKLTDL